MVGTRANVFLQSHSIWMMAIFPTYENNSFKLDVVRKPAMKATNYSTMMRTSLNPLIV